MRNKLGIFGFLLGIAIVFSLSIVHPQISIPNSMPESDRLPLPNLTSSESDPPLNSIGDQPQALPKQAIPNQAPPNPRASPRASTSLSFVDDMLSNLEWGNIVFDTPKKIGFEEPKVIELLLSPTKSIQELQSSLKSSEETESARIRISNRMEANLSGTGFRIEAIVPQEQAVSRGETTQWKWEVTPTKDGGQTLYLTLSTIINVSGKEVPLVVRTFEKTIEVDISTGQRISAFVDGNWQWLWATILVPLSPFLWNWYQKKRGKEQPTNTPGS